MCTPTMALSVSEMKQKLIQRGVDISRCIEKADLVAKLAESDKMTAEATTEDVAEMCDVCGEGDGELLLCDGGMLQGTKCNYAAHPSCVGVDLKSMGDDDEWLCMKCEAAKTMRQGGGKSKSSPTGSSPGKRVRAAKAKAPQGHNTGDGSDSEDMEEEEEEEEDYEEGAKKKKKAKRPKKEQKKDKEASTKPAKGKKQRESPVQETKEGKAKKKKNDAEDAEDAQGGQATAKKTEMKERGPQDAEGISAKARTGAKEDEAGSPEVDAEELDWKAIKRCVAKIVAGADLTELSVRKVREHGDLQQFGDLTQHKKRFAKIVNAAVDKQQ